MCYGGWSYRAPSGGIWGRSRGRGACSRCAGATGTATSAAGHPSATKLRGGCGWKENSGEAQRQREELVEREWGGAAVRARVGICNGAVERAQKLLIHRRGALLVCCAPLPRRLGVLRFTCAAWGPQGGCGETLNAAQPQVKTVKRRSLRTRAGHTLRRNASTQIAGKRRRYGRGHACLRGTMLCLPRHFAGAN